MGTNKIDYELFTFPKNKRIKNKKLLKDKQGKCKYCGKRAYTENHHIKTKGSGGHDTKENLIELCNECHYEKVHPGKISKEELRRIINEPTKKSIKKSIKK